MEKKFYYVVVGYCGSLLRTAGNQKYGYEDKIIPVYCTEDELDTIVPAIGKGFLGDAYCVYDNPDCDKYTEPFRMYKDCM